MIISTDITDRKQFEKKLQESTEQKEKNSEVTLDREKKLIELKKEINMLIKELSVLRSGTPELPAEASEKKDEEPGF